MFYYLPRVRTTVLLHVFEIFLCHICALIWMPRLNRASFFWNLASFWNLCLFNWNIYKSRKTKLQNNNKTKTGIERVNTFCCCSVLALEQLPIHVQFVLYVRIIFIEAWANCQLIECNSFSHRHGSITTLPINQFRGHSIDFAQIPL